MFKRPNLDGKTMRAFALGIIVGCLLTLGIAGVLLAHLAAEVEAEAEKARQEAAQAKQEMQEAERRAMQEAKRRLKEFEQAAQEVKQQLKNIDR